VNTGVVSRNESGADFQARVPRLYGQTNESDKENNFIALPNTCNQPGPRLVVTEPRVQNYEIYRVERYNSLVDTGVSRRSDASISHDKLQRVYDYVEQPEMDRAYTMLTKEWKSQMTWNPMDSEEEQELISGDGNGMSSEGEKPEMLTIHDEEIVQKVDVKNERRSSQLLTVQDEECNHTKWLMAHNLKEDNYMAVRWDTGSLFEPNQVMAVRPAYNNYIGTEWTMVNGLKVIVTQGHLVDAVVDVLVNPANSGLCHGGGTARAISVAAGKELDDECNKYLVNSVA